MHFAKKCWNYNFWKCKNTLETQLLNHLINSNIPKKHTTTGAAHRIDKDTHGPVIFYKDKLTAKCLGEMFENHEIHKEYFALVHGIFEPEKCSVKIPISGKESQTEFEKLARQNCHTSDLLLSLKQLLFQ